jgi:hypothetical protein
MEIVIFFWNALKELQNGANFGLRKTIRIIGGMFERAGIDLNALPTMEKRQTQDQNNNNSNNTNKNANNPGASQDQSLPCLPNSGLDMLADGSFRDFYNDLYVENIDWPAFIEDERGSENDELLYGLFRPGNENEDVLPSLAQSPAW